jgi:hypothetical protein
MEEYENWFDKVFLKCHGQHLIWLFTDQNFFPYLTADGTEPCPKIVRLENGEMQRNVGCFLSKYGLVVRGTDLVLVASATQLVLEGLAGFIDSYLEVAKQIRLGSQRGVVVLPAPFMLLGGTRDNHCCQPAENSAK